jgi:hypothetical protein
MIDNDTILRVRASLQDDLGFVGLFEGLEISMCCDIAQRNDPADRRLGYAIERVRDWMSRKNIH